MAGIPCWLGRATFPKLNCNTTCLYCLTGLTSLMKTQGALLAFLSPVTPVGAVCEIHCHLVHIHAPKVYKFEYKRHMGKYASEEKHRHRNHFLSIQVSLQLYLPPTVGFSKPCTLQSKNATVAALNQHTVRGLPEETLWQIWTASSTAIAP